MTNSAGFDDKLILRIIAEITPQVLEMTVGQHTPAKGMFDTDTWYGYDPDYRKCVIGDLISFLVLNKLIPFVDAGIYRNGRCNRYERVEIEPRHLIQPEQKR